MLHTTEPEARIPPRGEPAKAKAAEKPTPADHTVVHVVGARRTRARMRIRLAVGALLAATAAMVVGAAPAAAADDGPYATFTRCPIAALEAIPPDIFHPGLAAGCLVATTTSGSLTIGKTTVQLSHPDNYQVGFYNAGAGSQVVAPTFEAAPEVVPGGLLGLMCPSSNPTVHALCVKATNNPNLLGVTATAQLAGPVTGALLGIPQQLPLKIKLHNVLLGSNCYIGTNSNPIALNLQTSLSNLQSTADPFFTNLVLLSSTATQTDTSFSVPGATGCGGALLAPLLDKAINAKQGLPSPSGNNAFTQVANGLAADDFCTPVADGGIVGQNACTTDGQITDLAAAFAAEG